MTLSIKFKMNKSFIFLEDAIENVVFICTPRSDGFSAKKKKTNNVFNQRTFSWYILINLLFILK